MKYTKLGKTELTVSRICMGCMGFGNAATGQHSWTVNEVETRGIIKHGLDLGINFYDTAIAYQNGTSEQYVGRALRDCAKRDDYVIATKFTPRTQDEIDAGVSGQKHIENYLDQSLRNLGTDYVDLYIYHMWDYHTPMEEIMEGLHNAVKAGKARYIGISNCFAWQLAKANFYAREHGLHRICFNSRTLQPDRPRGRARDGAVLQKSEYRDDAVQRACGQTAFKAPRRNIDAIGKGRLREIQIRRDSRSEQQDHCPSRGACGYISAASQ